MALRDSSIEAFSASMMSSTAPFVRKVAPLHHYRAFVHLGDASEALSIKDFICLSLEFKKFAGRLKLEPSTAERKEGLMKSNKS